MSAPLRIHSEPVHAPNRRDAADAWLDRVTAMLRVPMAEREAIRAELNEHLRERIRDLMLSGAGEGAATSQAIGELGDAAMLARRYQEAIEPSSRRSLMHVGIATAATAALVFSGAALFQGGATPPAPPSGGNALAASPPAPAGSIAEAELRARLDEANRAFAQSRDIIAQQERELAGRRGEIESMELRLRIAEERAGSLQKESFDVHRQYEAAREDARRAQAELEKAEHDRDAALSRLSALEATAAAKPPTPPVTYAPEPNPAREVLSTLKIRMSDAATLGAIMAQPAIRDAKVYLRNERLSQIKLDGSNALSLPNRELSLGELLDLISATGSPPMGLDARQMPDGRIAIDLIDSWDRASRALVIYDLSDIEERAAARFRSQAGPFYASSIAQLQQVITKTVTPDLWQDNGGDIGAIQSLNSSLVITAPERSHHQIRWIIEQVRSSSSRVDVPLLSDLPLVDVKPVEVHGREISTTRPAGKHEYPAPIESKGEPAAK